jgi:hypothetical protein
LKLAVHLGLDRPDYCMTKAALSMKAAWRLPSVRSSILAGEFIFTASDRPMTSSGDQARARPAMTTIRRHAA